MENQPEPTLVALIHHNNWANAQVFAACLNLTADQLAAVNPGAYGTIHETLGHMIYAEADYVGRMTGSRPQPPFDWEAQPSLAEIAAFSVQVDDALLDAVRHVPPTFLVHEEEGGNSIDYHARLLFMQAINHGIEHRTNITTILSGIGLPALEIDGWGYLFSHPDEFALKEISQ